MRGVEKKINEVREAKKCQMTAKTGVVCYQTIIRRILMINPRKGYIIIWYEYGYLVIFSKKKVDMAKKHQTPSSLSQKELDYINEVNLFLPHPPLNVGAFIFVAKIVPKVVMGKNASRFCSFLPRGLWFLPMVNIPSILHDVNIMIFLQLPPCSPT